MGIFRAQFVEPPAIEAEVVVETSRFGIEGVMQKRNKWWRASARGPTLFQFVEQHRENESARIVIRAVALGKIGEQ